MIYVVVALAAQLAACMADPLILGIALAISALVPLPVRFLRFSGTLAAISFCADVPVWIIVNNQRANWNLAELPFLQHVAMVVTATFLLSLVFRPTFQAIKRRFLTE